MSKPRLFEPLTAGSLQMANRIVIAPMCQYSAVDGRMTDWHLIHLGQLALSGAGLLTIEATAVLPEGRISYGDIGLWDDATEAAMDAVLQGIRRWSSMPMHCSRTSWRLATRHASSPRMRENLYGSGRLLKAAPTARSC